MARNTARASDLPVVWIVVLTLVACDRAGTRELKELSLKLDQANTRIEQLSQRLSTLDFRMNLERDRYKSAVFDPADKGFARLDTSVGSFAVSLEDVAAYADGVRVRLHVGNLTTATVNGGKFQIKWGPRMPPTEAQDFASNYPDRLKSVREKTVDFQDNLRSGTWNNVTLVLPGIPPAQFGYLELSMSTPRISLSGPY